MTVNTIATMVVAIDGPSGAGKGTVARAVARELEWRYIDTGAMYRAVAWRTLTQGFSVTNEASVASVVSSAVFKMDVEDVSIDGESVEKLIRTPEIDVAAATVARMLSVRKGLVFRQRQYASEGPLVMEGRDIGTVVFPDALVKIYLDAKAEERAKRRAKDPSHGFSQAGELGVVVNALEARDYLDRTREASPLIPAPDAVLIDTTKLTVKEVIDRVLGIARDRLGRRGSTSEHGSE